MSTLATIGDVMGISELEWSKYTEADHLNQINYEIGNFAPEDYNEHQVANRIVTQFSWGSRYCPPFVHSDDTSNGVIATLGKLGK